MSRRKLSRLTSEMRNWEFSHPSTAKPPTSNMERTKWNKQEENHNYIKVHFGFAISSSKRQWMRWNQPRKNHHHHQKPPSSLIRTRPTLRCVFRFVHSFIHFALELPLLLLLALLCIVHEIISLFSLLKYVHIMHMELLVDGGCRSLWTKWVELCRSDWSGSFRASTA